jgi:hypothetical protein
MHFVWYRVTFVRQREAPKHILSYLRSFKKRVRVCVWGLLTGSSLFTKSVYRTQMQSMATVARQKRIDPQTVLMVSKHISITFNGAVDEC